jgi:hypothetical protein
MEIMGGMPENRRHISKTGKVFAKPGIWEKPPRGGFSLIRLKREVRLY